MSGILILGGTGMLGHEVWSQCSNRPDTHATVRAESAAALTLPVQVPKRTVFGVRAEALETVERALDATQPDVVVNCVGIVKQLTTAPDDMVRINALYPHQLAAACAARGARLIHLSTDCVFSGRRGRYSEGDLPDPIDLYGRSKLAGEVGGERTLTLRTSMLGWELGGRRQGLLEWFISQAGSSVGGYTRALFSGPTAPALSRAILCVADDHPDLAGVLHVGAEPIAKYDLLVALREALDIDIEISADADLVIDRSLDASTFSAMTEWQAPAWSDMLDELASLRPASKDESVARG